MKTFTYTTKNQGIRSREADLLVKIVKAAKTKAVIQAKGKQADMQNRLALGNMQIGVGDTATVIIEGPAEDMLSAKLQNYFQNNL